jgi:hypothetical protein
MPLSRPLRVGPETLEAFSEEASRALGAPVRARELRAVTDGRNSAMHAVIVTSEGALVGLKGSALPGGALNERVVAECAVMLGIPHAARVGLLTPPHRLPWSTLEGRPVAVIPWLAPSVDLERIAERGWEGLGERVRSDPRIAAAIGAWAVLGRVVRLASRRLADCVVSHDARSIRLIDFEEAFVPAGPSELWGTVGAAISAATLSHAIEGAAAALERYARLEREVHRLVTGAPGWVGLPPLAARAVRIADLMPGTG